MHGDHVLGLPGLVGSMNLLGRTKALVIHGPANLERWLMEGLRLTESHLKFTIEFRPNTPIEETTIWSEDGISVESTPVKHRIEAYAYRFRWMPMSRNVKKDKIDSFHLKRTEIIRLKKNVDVLREDGTFIEADEMCHPWAPALIYVFSGDTAPCQHLTRLAKGADLLYHEATFSSSLAEKAKKTGHSTAIQAGLTAKEARVKKLVLGHFSSRYRSPEILLQEANSIFGDSELAIEGKTYTLCGPPHEFD